MKIRNQKEFLTSLPEGSPPPVPRQRITQWLYFSVLIFTASCVIYLIFDYNIHYFGNGHIETDKTLISSSHGGKIKSIHIETGQMLNPGDLIAKIVRNSQCDQPNSSDNNHMEKLRYEIAIKESQLGLLENDLDSLMKADDSFIIRRALEIGSSNQSNNAVIKKEQRKTKKAIALLKGETAVQKQRLRNAEKKYATTTTQNKPCDLEIITAPFSSRVFMLRHRSNEFTNKGETIAILANDNNAVHINAQFESKSQRYLKRGAVLEVELSDGWSTQGVVTEVFSSVFNSNKQLLKKEPGNFKVWAKITPIDEASKQRWLDNDLMGVNVRGEK